VNECGEVDGWETEVKRVGEAVGSGRDSLIWGAVMDGDTRSVIAALSPDAGGGLAVDPCAGGC
jgi:hypothetical protein